MRLLWQLCSAVFLVLSFEFRILGFAHAQEQVVLAEPGLDGTLNHIQYSPNTESNSPRHVAEKRRLLETLKRADDQNWTTDHPRFRLLQAMHGFIRHQERYTDQLDTWEESYLGLPVAQKKVSARKSVPNQMVIPSLTSSRSSSLPLTIITSLQLLKVCGKSMAVFQKTL
jgi:hypothetical protein